MKNKTSSVSAIEVASLLKYSADKSLYVTTEVSFVLHQFLTQIGLMKEKIEMVFTKILNLLKSSRLRHPLMILIFPLLTGINSIGATELSIRISEDTIGSFIPLVFPSKIELTDSLYVTLNVNSVAFELNSKPAIIRLDGNLEELGKNSPIPISTEVSLDFAIKDGNLELEPKVIKIEPQYNKIPLSQPLTLIKAWFLSVMSISLPSVNPISIPFQTRIDIPYNNKTIRSRENLGGASVDVVAQVSSRDFQLNISANSISVVNKALWINFSTDNLEPISTPEKLELTMSQKGDG
jgi:hypothetical protein